MNYPNPTTLHGLHDVAYRAIKRVSKHDTDLFAKNPYAWMQSLENPIEEEPTPAMQFGTAVHAAILEPDKYAKEFAVMPDTIKTRRGKEWDAFKAEHEGATIIKAEEAQLIEGICATLRKNDIAQKILDATAQEWREVSIMFQLCGVECKSRIDGITVDGTVWDLKTAADVSPDAFMRSCDDFAYDVQAAMYIRAAEAAGINVTNFAFVAVEKTFPFTPGIYTFSRDSDFVRAGEMELLRRLGDIARWKRGDMLIPAGFVEHNLPLPPWSKRAKRLAEVQAAPF